MQKLSMGLSVFVALCIVSIFCVVSVVIIENIDDMAQNNKDCRVNLQNNKEINDFIL